MPLARPLRRSFSTATILFAAVLACLPGLASAQPAGARGDDFLYRARQGDTLIGLAAHYTGNDANWTTLQSVNAIAEPRQLPIGRELRIPLRLIPVRDGQAQVVHVSGQVSLDGAPLAKGKVAKEGNIIRTGPNGFATLRLDDGSTLTIPASSTVAMDRLRVFQRAELTDSVLKVEQGSLESEVAPGNQGVGRFEVRTPVSITGVRGTRLRVHATDGGAASEVLTGRAHVDGADQATRMLARNQGIAVDAQGRLSLVQSLLPAPSMTNPQRAGGGWQITFYPVRGAAAYLVRVARDAEGTQLFSSRTTTDTSLHVPLPGAGQFHVLVRALDPQGLGGHDAVQAVEGQHGLVSSDGAPIVTGFGDLVQLTAY